MPRRRLGIPHAALILACCFWALLAVGLAGCESTPPDDPLVIRDEDPLKAFMFPASRDMAWTYRRESVGLVAQAATVSIAVTRRKKESATLDYAVEGEEAPEIAQGIGIRGAAEVSLLPDGAVRWKDDTGERTYYPDGTVEHGPFSEEVRGPQVDAPSVRGANVRDAGARNARLRDADEAGARDAAARAANSKLSGATFELIGTETITTPAGKFACVKYRVRRAPSADFPMRLEGTLWWGKGAGLVRAISNVEGFSAGTRTTIELIELER